MEQWLFESNFTTLIILVFMSVFLSINSIFSKKINSTFGLSILLTAVDVAVSSAEKWTAGYDCPPSVCIFFCAMGYTVRPMIIYLFLKLSLRNYDTSRRTRILMITPMVLNDLAVFSAFFTDIVYTYNSSNEFVRGPLGYFTHVISLIYMIALMVLTVKRFCSRDYSEGLTIFLILTINIVAMISESIVGIYGTTRTAYALSIVFYYLFFSVESFKRDPLTNSLNRRCFYTDSEKHKEELTAVVSIDLNDLKKINDTMGHAKGDEAICTTVKAIDKAVPKGCSLYRTGGDEFMILCIKKERCNVERLLSDIRSELSKTPYTCALGVAYTDGEDFDSICAKADAEMYKDKQLYKTKVAI
ncbi:MAG: GGDEF domain-containing protein [Huintestinicola sp.]